MALLDQRAASLVAEQLTDDVLTTDAEAVADMLRRVEAALAGEIRASYADGESRSI